MATSTPELATGSLTRVRVGAVDGTRVRVETDVAGPSTAPALRPMLLASDTRSARISLVPDGAMLLAGDRIGVAVEVGEGASLTLVEPGGTVAYDMDGGRATWSVTIDLAAGATLVWAGEPFVVSAGADVTRDTRIAMAPGSRLALRETLVLGRHGERPGRARTTWEAHDHDGRPLLVESLDLDAGSLAPGLLGPHRVLGSVTALGCDVPPDACPDGRLDLERGGTLWRHLAGEAHEIPRQPWECVTTG
ncbi:urease accessory protein UreD [Nocardioides sp. KC13]|uniref:Urease accessory protein UreD n=1 Tax=Nocardioides turkmenicus TaxID=2711220 RepID=A0A6M1REY9_9ACTN|nr:urease accessory protein UreD [Nocardioides sp. KC13]NGN94857.1 urease accessory protein UreD [Nocardioides sp. KC13]